MKRPARPSSAERAFKHCDGTVTTWTPKWTWVPEECQECGHPEPGYGTWVDPEGSRLREHKGHVQPEARAMRERGRYDCCGLDVPSFEEMMRAVYGQSFVRPHQSAILTNITDPGL